MRMRPQLSPCRYLEPGKPYTYTVQAVTSLGGEGPPSPPLHYSPEQGFCGDGRVDYKIGEECDDGNVRDADGCNMQCKKEDVFHCTGESCDPSRISSYCIDTFSSRQMTRGYCLDEETNSHKQRKRNMWRLVKRIQTEYLAFGCPRVLILFVAEALVFLQNQTIICSWVFIFVFLSRSSPP